MDLEDIKTNCVAVLTSGGGQATQQSLMRDYKNLIGEFIPYSKYGFPSLRALLESLGGFYVTKNNFGEIIFNMGYDEKTAHISSLISRQKKKPGSGKGKRKPSFRSHARPPPPYAGSAHHVSHQRIPPRPRAVPPRVVRQPYSGPSIIAQRRPISSSVSQPSSSKPTSGPPIIPQRQPISPPKPKIQQPILPPVSKMTNSGPPIIPQRQALSSVQKRLEVAPSLNVQAAHAAVVSVKSDQNGLQEKSDSKEQSAIEEPSEEANYVDIQRRPLKSPVVPVPSKSPMAHVSSKPDAPLPSQPQSIPLESNVIFKSYVTELFQLSKKFNLGLPEYKVIQCPGIGRKLAYIAKLKIGDNFDMSSYPDEKPTGEEAQELVAKLACEELSRRLNPHLPSECLESNSIVDRVYEIVAGKTNGMFDEAVMNAYVTNHKTRLPSAWLELISNSERFTLENLAGKFIIYPKESPEEAQDIGLAISNGTSPEDTEKTFPLSSSTSPIIDINANRVIESKSPVVRKPPTLSLPEDSTWDVFVASISSNVVWIRFIGDEYDVKYNNLMNDLELKLLSHCVPATDVIIDDYYVAKFDNCWVRVQLKEVANGADECQVFLIDNGEVDTIPLSELYVLDNEFLGLPAQALQCRLAYIDLRFEEAQSYVLSHVIGSSFVAEVMVPPSENTMATVVLHNTEHEGKPVNMNFNILNEIIKSLSCPKLPLRHVAVLRLTHIEKGCLPWVQMEGRDLGLLELILEDLSYLDLVEIHGVNAHPRLGHEDMILVRSKKLPLTFRRGIISNSKDAKSPTVRFVDYGHEEKCMWSDIFDIEKILPVLKSFPAQAFQIPLKGLSASQLVDGVVKRLREIVPESEKVLGKINDDETGAVELFRRLLPDNIIASVNSDLIFNLDEYSKNVDLEVKEEIIPAVTTSTCPRGLTDPLQPFEIPPVDSEEYFDIIVTISSNPSNFTIQPLSHIPTFDTLMTDMQVHYEAQCNIMPPPAAHDLVEGATFAAKHADDLQWYRVSIVAALSTETVSVRYSDYGDVGILPVDRIRYLEPKFRQLPALAVRAKLFGLKPKNADWSVEDCVYFNNLVQNKPFVSRILAKNSQNDIENTWKVGLDLYDTSGDDDIKIASVLIERGIAEEC